MNQFQTREERKQEMRQNRRRDFWLVITLAVVTFFIALESQCDSDDTPMFIKTESSNN
jgi:ABC-type microcin C transport system permease subunit YejE